MASVKVVDFDPFSQSGQGAKPAPTKTRVVNFDPFAKKPDQAQGGQSVDQLVDQNTPAGLKPGGHVDYRDDGSGETLPSSLQDADPRTARATAMPAPPRRPTPASDVHNLNPATSFWSDYTRRVSHDAGTVVDAFKNDQARGKFVNDAWRRGGPAAARAAEHQWDAAHRGAPSDFDAAGAALDLTPFGAPIEAAGDTVVGRPLEATTGIPRQVAGDVAGMAVPAYEGAKLAGAGEEALRAAITRGRFRPAETPPLPGRVAPPDQLLRDARRPAPQPARPQPQFLPAIDPKGASFDELKAARQGARRAERQGGARPLQQVELRQAARGAQQAAEDAQGRAARLSPEQLAQARAGATRIAEDVQGRAARIPQHQIGEAGRNLAARSTAEEARAEAGQGSKVERAKAVQVLKDEGIPTRRGETADRAFRTTMYDGVMKQIGDRAPRGLNDRQTFAAVNKKLSDRYDRLLPSLKMVEDEQFQGDVNKIIERSSALGVKEDIVRRVYNHAMEKRVGPNGELYGQGFKDAESELNDLKLALNKEGFTTAADAIDKIQEAMRSSLERHSAPAVRGELKKLNGAYRDFAVLRRAATQNPRGLGAWDAGDALDAINALDYSAGKGQFGRGRATMQDLAESAYRVLGPKQKNKVVEAGKNLIASAAYGTTGHPIAATHSAGRAIRELTQ